MAFKVRKTNHRAWPVTVKHLECDDQGAVTTVEQTFVAHFKAFSEADHAAVVGMVDGAYPVPPDGTARDSARTLERNAFYFSRLLCGWGKEVTDADGVPITFSVEGLTAIVTGPDGMAFSAALTQAITELRFGMAPAKNSVTSPVPGETSGAGEGVTNSLMI